MAWRSSARKASLRSILQLLSSMWIMLWFLLLMVILMWCVFVLRLFFISFLMIDVGCLMIFLVVIWFVNFGGNMVMCFGLCVVLFVVVLW